jgi:hypothetical protein
MSICYLELLVESSFGMNFWGWGNLTLLIGHPIIPLVQGFMIAQHLVSHEAAWVFNWWRTEYMGLTFRWRI